MADPFSYLVALTGNNTTIYAILFVDLAKDGPVVIDSPAGAYGVIDDFWQRPIVEVGPFGPDNGKGGKFLLLPPVTRGTFRRVILPRVPGRTRRSTSDAPSSRRAMSPPRSTP
jgi:hypothetical protein